MALAVFKDQTLTRIIRDFGLFDQYVEHTINNACNIFQNTKHLDKFLTFAVEHNVKISGLHCIKSKNQLLKYLKVSKSL